MIEQLGVCKYLSFSDKYSYFLCTAASAQPGGKHIAQ